MNLRNLADIIAILDKIQIQTNPNLSDEQKEIYKHCIDELKKKVQ